MNISVNNTFNGLSIDSDEGEVHTGDAVFASSIKTHLKKLNAAELGVLSRHAAGLLSKRIKDHLKELET